MAELLKKQKSEEEILTEIREAAFKEAEKLKKEDKTVTSGSVEVICREEDIFHTKSKKKS